MKQKEIDDETRFKNAVAYASSSDTEDVGSDTNSATRGFGAAKTAKKSELPPIKESSKPKHFKGIPVMEDKRFFDGLGSKKDKTQVARVMMAPASDEDGSSSSDDYFEKQRAAIKRGKGKQPQKE